VRRDGRIGWVLRLRDGGAATQAVLTPPDAGADLLAAHGVTSAR